MTDLVLVIRTFFWHWRTCVTFAVGAGALPLFIRLTTLVQSKLDKGEVSHLAHPFGYARRGLDRQNDRENISNPCLHYVV